VKADDLPGYASVQRWIGADPPIDPIETRLRKRKLDVLAAFCAHQGLDPDAMVEESHSSRTVKNNHMRDLRKWIPTYVEGERARHDAENVVRAFFMTNGLRVLAKPHPDIYHRPSRQT
jgi:hypothetical protein